MSWLPRLPIAALFLLCSIVPLFAQQVAYGTNAAAGHYVQLPDAKIYYERYGSGGRPLVMLHGGVYGYIDEFATLIQEISKTRTVIAIATRGYGRSERGTRPLSHRQFAEDAAAVMKDVLKGEKADLLGFSEGGITSYIVAFTHPELVNRLVAIGGPLRINVKDDGPPLTPEQMQKDSPNLVARRKKQMLHPEQFDALIRELVQLYRGPVVFVKEDEAKSIKASTLILAGDQDPGGGAGAASFAEVHTLLPGSQLAIVPGCGHVVFHCKPELTLKLTTDFIQ